MAVAATLISLVAAALPLVFVASANAQPTAEVDPAIEQALARGETVELIVTAARGAAADGAERAQRSALRADLSEIAALAVGGEFVFSPSVTVSVSTPEELRAVLRVPNVESVRLGSEEATMYLAQARELTGAAVSNAIGVRGQGATVAMLDSGIEGTHPDLASSISFEACFMINHEQGGGHCRGGQAQAFGAGTAPESSIGHGTYVGGVVASAGTVAPVGFAPEADLEVYKLMSDVRGVYKSDTIRALEYIATNRPEVDVVNISFGFDEQYTGTCDADFPGLAGAIKALRDRGVVVVAASGNNSLKTVMGAPACLTGVISVAAAGADPRWDFYKEITDFSNMSTVTDLAAPGSVIQTTKVGHDTGHIAGTSIAAAAVSGCAALLAGATSLSGAALEARLLDTHQSATNTKGRSLPIVDCLVDVRPDGNADCSSDGLTVSDVRVILQFMVRSRSDSGGCPIEDSGTQANAAAGDISHDGVVSVADALIMLNCATGAVDSRCPDR